MLLEIQSLFIAQLTKCFLSGLLKSVRTLDENSGFAKATGGIPSALNKISFHFPNSKLVKAP